MKILFNRHSQKYLPIVIDDTSDMDKVIDTFYEWIEDSDNEMLLELDIYLHIGGYSITEEWDGVLYLVHMDYDVRGGFCHSYEFELRDLSTIKIK